MGRSTRQSPFVDELIHNLHGQVYHVILTYIIYTGKSTRQSLSLNQDII